MRLYQGDPGRETVYGEQPAEVARQWESLGARFLHVVDLDGAFTGGCSANAAAVKEIGQAIRIPFQLGGGMRSRESIEQALAAGASKVVLGTLLVEQPELAARLAGEFGGCLVAGIDARNNQVAVRGWQEISCLTDRELARMVEGWGIREVVYTDIQRDGTLKGPNLEGLAELTAATTLEVIASGGISSKDDLERLKPFRGRVKGVIIGKALYSNRLTLAEAMRVLET